MPTGAELKCGKDSHENVSRETRKEKSMVIAFIVGVIIGGALGMLFTACLVASGKEEDDEP